MSASDSVPLEAPIRDCTILGWQTQRWSWIGCP